MTETKYPQHKIRTVYIETWLLKYLQAEADFSETGELIVKGPILVPPDSVRHPERLTEYFKKNEDKAELHILSRQMDLRMIYALMRYYKKCFYRDMITYTVARHGIVPAQTALRDFLRSLQIWESDYATESAYKHWQRSREYKNLPKGASLYSGTGNVINLKFYSKVKELLHEQHQLQLFG